MKKITRIFNILLVALTALSLSSCEDSEISDANEDQREQITSFLEGAHSPQLIPESEVSTSISIDPPFYTIYGDFGYRYIEDYYNPLRDEKAIVQSGATLLLTYSVFVFEGSAISEADLPLYTNDEAYKAIFESAEIGLNTQYWSFQPQEVTLGGADAIPAVFEGLVGAREGDKVEIYSTVNMGYGGGESIGTVPKNSALVIFVEILSIN